MKDKEKAKFVTCIFILALVVSIPVLWGCRYIFWGTNAEVAPLHAAYPESRILFPVGEVYHGALRDGKDKLLIYTGLEEKGEAEGNVLQIYHPAAETYITLDDSTKDELAALVRDEYVEVHPGNVPTERTSVNFILDEENPESPVFEMEIFVDPEGPGTLHTFILKGYAPDGHPSMRIYLVAEDKYEYMDMAGRRVVIREGDPEDNIRPKVRGAGLVNLSRDPYNPALVGTGDEFTFTTNEELGLVFAVALEDDPESSTPYCSDLPDSECFDGKEILMWTSYLDVDLSGANPRYVYTLKTAENYSLVSGTDYALLILVNIAEDKDGWNLTLPARYQRGTQDMNGNVIKDNNQDYLPDCKPGCSVGNVLSGDDNEVQYMVLPYFFTTTGTRPAAMATMSGAAGAAGESLEERAWRIYETLKSKSVGP